MIGEAVFDRAGIGVFDNTGIIRGSVVRIDAATLTNGITDPNRTTAPSRLPDPVIDLFNLFSAPGASSVSGLSGASVADRGGAAVAGRDGLVTLPGLGEPVTAGDVRYLSAAPIPGDANERGPAWILEQTGDARRGLTFFADPTVERRAIQQALLDQTGRTLLDPRYRNPAEQQQALWQGTVEFLKANPDIRLGDELTAAQRARIIQPILWYRTQTINGTPTLVPQLLLPQARLEEWRRSNGGVIAGNDIYLSGDGIRNTGAVLAENQLAISAGSFINERRVANTGYVSGTMQHGIQDGGFLAGDLVRIVTTGDLVNTGGSIVAGSSLSLVTGGDLIVNASVVSNEVHDGSKKHSIDYATTTNYGSTIYSGGNASIRAGGDLSVAGSSIVALANALVTAGGAIAVASVENESRLEQAGRKGNALKKSNWTSSDASTTNVSSLITAGGDLTVAAAGDVSVHASNIVAGGDALVAAGAGANGDRGASVTITAGQDSRSTSYSTSKSGLFGGGKGWADLWSKKTVSSGNTQVTNVGSSLSAGGDLTVVAPQDIAVQGSALSAGGLATLDAGRDIAVTPGYDGTSAYYKKTEKGIGIGASADASSAKVQVGYHSRSTQLTLDTATVAPSLIQGGAGVTAIAGRDITLQAAQIGTPGDLALIAGRDIDAGVAYTTSSQTARQSELFIGITSKVSQNVTSAIEQLKQAARTFNSGHGSTAYEAIGMASGIMQATDAVMAITNPTVSASVMIGAEGRRSSSYEQGAQAVPSQLAAGGNLLLDAGNDIRLKGTQAYSGGDTLLTAGDDLTVESAQSRAASGSQEQSWNAGFGLGASVGVSTGSAGFRAEAGVSRSDSDSLAVLQNNARIIADGGVRIQSGRDTTVAGAVIRGSSLNADIGGDLTVQSRQDRVQSNGSSISAGASVQFGAGASGSVNAGGGRSKSDKAWVSEQSGLYASGPLNIRVDNHTALAGAVIASDNGDLTLDTGALAFSDIHDYDKASSRNANVGVSNDPNTGRPSGVTLSGSVSDRNREQITRATVGEGQITVRDEAAQTQDVAMLNRDTAKAQEITRDESSGVEFYASSSAIQEITSGFKTTQENIKRLGKADKLIPKNIEKAQKELDYSISQIKNAILDAFVADGTLNRSSRRKLDEVLARFQDIDPQSICPAPGQSGFNLLDLFVTTAHAAPGGCELRFAGGASVNMTPEEMAALREAQVQGATEAIQKHMPRYRELLALQESGALTPEQAGELSALGSVLLHQMSIFELCAPNPGDLRASGLIPNTPTFDTLLRAAENYRHGGDAVAAKYLPYAQDSGRMLLALKTQNPDLYFATYRILYGRDENLTDSIYLLNGAARPGISAEDSTQLLKVAASQMAEATLRNGVTTFSSLPAGQRGAIGLAVADLSIEQKLELVAEYDRYVTAHNEQVATSVQNARVLTAGLVTTVFGGALAVPVSRAVIACYANPLCRAEAAIAIGEAGAGDALAGSSLSSAVAKGAKRAGKKFSIQSPISPISSMVVRLLQISW